MDIDVEDHGHDVALLRRSLALAERHIDAASNVADAPTPCVDWNAGQLVSHLIATLRANAALFTATLHRINPFDPEPIPAAQMLADFQQAPQR